MELALNVASRMAKLYPFGNLSKTMRYNSEGIRREELAWALTQRHIVAGFRRIDRCMLCRNPHVNEAALCPVCTAMLNDEELRQVERWMNGIAP